MPRFFQESPHPSAPVIVGEDAAHIARVLRMKEGDSLILCDCKSTDIHCTITSVSPSVVCLQAVSSALCNAEPTVFVRLYQALPKADKMEMIIQKAVELGVSEIVPIMTHRCVSRPDEKSMEKKIVRWQRIAYEAAKQSGRGIIPAVLPMMEFAEAVAEGAGAELPIFFYENSTTPISGSLPASFAFSSILVGSEGGFTESEAEAVAQSGWCTLSLGRRILRCETAPLAAITALMYASGNM